MKPRTVLLSDTAVLLYLALFKLLLHFYTNLFAYIPTFSAF